MKWVRILRKYYEYALTKMKVLQNQRIIKCGEVNLKYMYRPAEQAETLTIVFSACTRPGLTARYNYVKTLDGMPCNRLYILDDFGEDKRGSYYLGRMPEFNEQEAVITLIGKFIEKTKPKKVIFCGSCKGGYAALNFGSRYQDAVMIVGEPTYRIATEFRLAEGLMRYWMGEITEQGISFMDKHLSEQLRKNRNISNQKIYLFYSVKDEYYEPHTIPLLKDLKESGYVIETETADFEAHADLGLYFADYLKKQLTKNL